MADVLVQHQIGILVFLSALLIIAASNWRALQLLDQQAAKSSHPIGTPNVSVLIPARNEAANILPMVESILKQDYQNFQILVLDDNSEDETGLILAELANLNSRVCFLQGQPLPEGWMGKQWACHQLAQAATGELLLFTDADTRHSPQTLSNAIAVLLAERTDLLTALPHQEMLTWGERLIVPLLYWSFMVFIPLSLAYRIKIPALSMAIGQFILIRRQALEQIGGFEAIRKNAADDLSLVRRVKAQGLRWKVIDGGMDIRCRMYTNFEQAREGISKNLFAVFDYRILPFIFVWLWLGLVFIGPLVVLAAGALSGLVSQISLLLAGIAVLEAFLLWLIVVRRFRFPIRVAMFYPFNILTAIVLALRAVILNIQGKATWKGRRLARQDFHWL
jgi:chlorobactene glucosyltransferase